MLTSDEENGRAMYEREADNWPSPIGWDNLEPVSRFLWTERAKKQYDQNRRDIPS